LKSTRKTVIQLALGSVFVAWFVTSLNWSEVWNELGKADWSLLCVATAILIGTYLVRALRWRALLPADANASLTALFRATTVGFTALFLMGRAGEMIVRPAILSMKARVRPSASYATVMIERVFDMVTVVVIFAVDLAIFDLVTSDTEARRTFGAIKVSGLLLFAASVAGIYGLSVFRRRRQGVLRYIERKLAKIHPRNVGTAIVSLVRHISEGLAVLHDVRGLAITLSYTILMWAMVGAVHLLVIRAFGISAGEIPLSGVVFVMGLSMIGSAVPTPGGSAGPFHAATVAALVLLGIARNKAGSVAIILHLVLFAPATVFGFFFAIRDGISIVRLAGSASDSTDRMPSSDSSPATDGNPDSPAPRTAAAGG
jgi:uncharacterized protein (TIRG00374 family)